MKKRRALSRDERLARFLRWADRKGYRIERPHSVSVPGQVPRLPPSPPYPSQPHDPDNFAVEDVSGDGSYLRFIRSTFHERDESGPWVDLVTEGDVSGLARNDASVRAFLDHFRFTKFEWEHLPARDRMAIRDALRIIVPVLEDAMRFAIDPAMGWGEEVLQQSGIRLLAYLAKRTTEFGKQKGAFQNRFAARARWKKDRGRALRVIRILQDVKDKEAVRLSRRGAEESLAAEINARLVESFGPEAGRCVPADVGRLRTQSAADAGARLFKALGIDQDSAGRTRTRTRRRPPPSGNDPAR